MMRNRVKRYLVRVVGVRQATPSVLYRFATRYNIVAHSDVQAVQEAAGMYMTDSGVSIRSIEITGRGPLAGEESS